MLQESGGEWWSKVGIVGEKIGERNAIRKDNLIKMVLNEINLIIKTQSRIIKLNDGFFPHVIKKKKKNSMTALT